MKHLEGWMGAIALVAIAACSATTSTDPGAGAGAGASGDDAGSAASSGGSGGDDGTGSGSGGVSSSGSGGGDDDGSGDDAGTIDPGDGAVVVIDDGGTPLAFPAPTQGSLFGAFVGAEPETQTDSQSETLYGNAEALINRRWVIDNRFYDDKTEWVNDRTQWDIDHHKIPLVTWMPYGNGAPLDEIIAGQHDATITAEAQKAKALGTQVLLRWGHEMNGNWYPWSGASNGSNAAAAAKYVTAWKHVHDLFVQAGATNVIWVWCPLVDDVPNESWNHWTNYYPGDDYVDWVGLDAYNWGTSSSCCSWESFGDLVDAPYQDYAGKKPIMLPETASAEVGGDKAGWIADMRHMMETRYTAIHAVVWFDINKETDWRINSSPATLAAYRAMALDPYFAP